MLASVIVLTLILASLRLVQSAAIQRSGHTVRFQGMRMDRGAALGVQEVGLVAAEVGGTRGWAAGERRVGRSVGAARPTEVAFIRSDSWRYYGFSIKAPEADAAVVPPASATDALAVGSVVSTLPDECLVTEVNGCVYRRCGNVWFQPQYTGSDVTYVVVRAP